LLGFAQGLASPIERSLWGDLLQWIALLDLIAISGGQLDDLRSRIENVAADAAAAAALEITSAWRSLRAVQPRERLWDAIRLTPDYTCLHVANIDLVEAIEEG
jgi:cysteine sulfinate desulfinase/cysteine desulfurase-like protein